MWNSDLAITFFPPFFVSSWREFKDYVHYKTITSQNELSTFCNQLFYILMIIPNLMIISWFTKTVKSWWVLVHQIGWIVEYIFWTTTHLVTILAQLIDMSKHNTFQESFEKCGGLGLSSRFFSIKQPAPNTQ